jgi:hypothetical protein
MFETLESLEGFCELSCHARIHMWYM